MKFIKTIFVLSLIVMTTLSCSMFHSYQLVKLPVIKGPNSLDSAQAEAVFNFAQHCPNGTQISICIIIGDSENYVGIKRRIDSLVYINNSDKIFEIGSITKPFTGILFTKLIYDGKINPDEPIKNILPIHMKYSSAFGKEITLTDLALHTSGLPHEPSDVKENNPNYDPYDPYKGYSIEKLYNYLSNKMYLQSVPGEKRIYSNLGYGLLGHILTLITGKSYEKLLSETICTPLGMKNTFVTFNNERKLLLVPGRDEKGQIIKSGEFPDAFVGCGGIKSTAEDLVKFLKSNMNDSTYFYLAQKTIRVEDEHFTGNYAWETYNEGEMHHVGAFGSTGGYTSGIIFERNSKVGVVVLTNVSAYLAVKGNYTENLCRALYDPLPYAAKKNK